MSKIKELEDKIIYHKALYYQGRPEISDLEFDKIENELKKIDPENPVLSIVGTSTISGEKVVHQKKMLSLEKTYDEVELKKWCMEHETISMLKLDGVSCSLIYRNGELNIAKTRGDGQSGENITEKIIWFSSIPKKISIEGDVEIRGEMYCTDEQFSQLCDEMEKMKLDRPNNQRNIVAGLMGRKENVELSRYLNFMAFDVIGDVIREKKLKNESQKFELLEVLNFQIPEVKIIKNERDVETSIHFAEEFMNEGEYQVDGLVCVYNNLSLHEELGETSHHPRYKIAFKFAGVSKKTKIEEITWQVSRNGILTPVAEVVPVELSGAMISRVALHNFGVVKMNQLKKGDEIEIIRSGEVIPKFLSVVSDGGQPFKTPKKCPSCESALRYDSIRIFCDNKDCIAKNKEQILKYIVEIGIENLSEKRLDEMFNKGLVKSVADLYKLTFEDLLTLDKTKEKLAQKLLDSIQTNKKVDLVKLLSAIGIQGVAQNKIEKIIDHGNDTLDKIKKLTVDDLVKIDGFAEKSAKLFVESLSDKNELIKSLREAGLEIVISKLQKRSDTQISNKKICITGELSVARSSIEKQIKEAGGIVVTSVSKNTDFLLTNETDSGSSKFKKALELKITIITEAQFQEML